MNKSLSADAIPLVADLDGSLSRTDLLHEALILLIKKNPVVIFQCLLWLLKGRLYFKNRIFEQVQLHYESLPYNPEVLQFIKEAFASGRKIVLATASPLYCATEVAKVHPVFNEVYGSSDKVNLKGTNKLKVLIEHYGEGRFDYIGDSAADMVIFKASRYAYVVNPSTAVARKVKKIANVKNIWQPRKSSIIDYIRAIRAYQWIKNLLLFVPLITSHSFRSLHLVTITFLAFLAFNLVASAGYLLNDLLDINADRKHPRKQFRAVASGRLSIVNAFIVATVFLVGGLIFAAKLSLYFLGILLLYFIISFTYSLFFKKIVLYDVFILALLYSIRVFAGAVVTGVPLSFWLIAFSTFIFLSLAFVKRYSELVQIVDDTNLKNRGRGYIVQDLSLLQMMGIVSGFLSVVVFSLYINSPEVTVLYSKPKLLWAISFLFLFWISRVWLFTTRGKMTDDPIIFAIKDITSYFIFLLTGLLILVSI